MYARLPDCADTCHLMQDVVLIQPAKSSDNKSIVLLNIVCENSGAATGI